MSHTFLHKDYDEVSFPFGKWYIDINKNGITLNEQDNEDSDSKDFSWEELLGGVGLSKY